MTLEEKISKTEEVWKETKVGLGFEKMGVGFTGRKDSSCMTHILLRLAKREGWKKLPTFFFIDHGAHFKKVLQHLKKLEKKWEIKIVRIQDERLTKRYNEEKNRMKKREILWGTKIALLDKTIRDNKWRAMVSSIRWDESEARKEEEYFSERKGHLRIHPMLHWTEDDIWKYIRENKILYNPMYDQGFRSIGEKGFTKKSGKGDERSGRDQVKEQVMTELRSMGYF